MRYGIILECVMEFEEWWAGIQPLHLKLQPESTLEDTMRAMAQVAWQAAQPQWMPIDTIPDDGRLVLVYRPLAHKTNDRSVEIKRALGGTNSGCWPKTVPAGCAPTNPTDGACHTTHWMPLPEVPEAKP